MVHVAHHRDDRRALDKLLLGVFVLGLLLHLVGGVDDVDLLVELPGEGEDRLLGERLGEGRHLAELHELLDDLGSPQAQRLGHLLDRRA